MLTPRFLSPIFAAVLAIGGTAGCSDGDTVDATLAVFNDSDYAITELYLTPVDSPEWGPNLLRGDVLLPGEDLVLGVDCDFYDALLVDEDGVECELYDLDLCLNDADWVINNNTCTVFGAAKQREQAPQVEQATTSI